MYYQHGAHRHQDNEVNLVRFEAIPQMTKRGLRWGYHYRLHLSGELIYGDQDTFKAKIQELADAYNINGVSSGLYHDDGTTVSPHFLPNNVDACLSGVRVEYRSWPKGNPEEYATCRTFYIIVGGIYINAESTLLSAGEVLQFYGTGESEWEWVKLQTGLAVQQIVYPYTTQKIVQTGTIKALSMYPIGNRPPPIYPTWEHRSRRVLRYFEPTFAGQRYWNFGIHYQYLMESPQFVNAAPWNTW